MTAEIEAQTFQKTPILGDFGQFKPPEFGQNVSEMSDVFFPADIL